MTTLALPLVRRLLAPVLAALSLASAVIVPALDAGDLDRRAVLESAHDRDACAHGHDHGICAQVAANAGISTDIARHAPLASSAARVAMPTPPRCSAPGNHSRALGPRAPPLA